MTIKDREILVRRLQEDLIGPFEQNEVLTSRPSDIYLTGILWPTSAKMGPEEDDRLAVANSSNDEGVSSDSGEEEVSRSTMNRPAAAGISFAANSSKNEPELLVRISLATYDKIEPILKASSEMNSRMDLAKFNWQRHHVEFEISINAGPSVKKESKVPLEQHGAPTGVYLHRRIARWHDNWLITLTLVNGYQADRNNRDIIEQHCLFQVRMEVRPGIGTKLIARPSQNIRLKEGYLDKDLSEEDRSTALLYRNFSEYAVGHTCSAEWDEGDVSGVAQMVATTWIPKVLVPATSPNGHTVFDALRQGKDIKPLSAKWLSRSSGIDLVQALSEISAAYSKWIDLQENQLDQLDGTARKQAIRNLENCRNLKDRMVEGAAQIGLDRNKAEAFRLANQAMQLQYNWDPNHKGEDLSWRPFQMGYILLSISSIADRTHKDRDTMDLLWFPTGGGKTEAYLFLIAFLAFYRRLASDNDPDMGGGVAAIMRYTLRLLTTQQFVRASSVILACEAIRRGVTGENERSADLGNIPFSIGLWVGGEATPNNFETAARSLDGSVNEPSPKQLTDCPSCRSTLEWYHDNQTLSIRVRCNNKKCVLNMDNVDLPVYTVDTDIYRECPTLLIGTVDKFAQLPRKSDINRLFSISSGNTPDLIVQDELHLISGPLGTLVGLYEVAIDRLFMRGEVLPKIIGSTATIRRADNQVRALFNRKVCLFPPPAINADDSGFAVIEQNLPGRLYIGVTTAGRSAKFTLQAVSASLLQSVSGNLTEEGTDNYWTMVSYFNSMRELGGAVVLMEDDVKHSMDMFAIRRKEQKREIDPPEELTSRRTQAEVREMLDKLSINAKEDNSLDVVLATNMLSVGVDIPRLGLMVVNGQPKGVSEYIQATSRVGRGSVPGLIIAVLNNAKPRDRSRYESFSTWHRILYRDVEATSVTPFASRARDRALSAVLVSLIRHKVSGRLENPRLTKDICEEIENIIDDIICRANEIDPEEIAVAGELRERLREWWKRKPKYYWHGYKTKESLLQDAERIAMLKATGKKPKNEKWSAMNNLRSVETSVRFSLKESL